MLYVGVDVHWKKSNVCMLDEQGRKIKQQEIRGGWNRMIEYVGGIQEPFAVCRRYLAALPKLHRCHGHDNGLARNATQNVERGKRTTLRLGCMRTSRARWEQLGEREPDGANNLVRVAASEAMN